MGTLDTGFETGTNGAAFTSAVSPFDATETSLSYTSTNQSHGNLGAALPTGGVTGTMRKSLGGRAFAFRYCLYIPAAYGSEGGTFRLSTGGTETVMLTVNHMADNTLRIRGRNSAILANLPALPVGSRVTIEGFGNVGTTTTGGSVRVIWYAGDNNTSLGGDTGNLTGLDLAGDAGTLLNGRFGKLSTQTTSTPWVMDDAAMRWDTDATGLIGPVAVAAAATVRPSGVTANPGAWVNQAGAASTGAALADEDDTTYNTNPGTNAAEAITYALPPLTSGGVTISVKALKPSGTVAPIRVELLEGTTVRVTRDITSSTATAAYDSGTNIATYTLDLTSGENSAITARTDLRVRITANPA